MPAANSYKKSRNQRKRAKAKIGYAGRVERKKQRHIKRYGGGYNAPKEKP